MMLIASISCFWDVIATSSLACKLAGFTEITDRMIPQPLCHLRYRVLFQFLICVLCSSPGTGTAQADSKHATQTDNPREQRLLRVGYVVDQSGPLVNDSRDFFAGSKVLFDELNAKGAERSLRISVSTRGGDGTPERARQAVLELLRDDKVDVILGLAGDGVVGAVAADEAVQQLGAPWVGPVSGLRLPPSEGSKRIFFTRADYGQEVQHVVRYFHDLGLSRLVVLRQWNTSVAMQRQVHEALIETVDAKGLTLTELTLPATGPDRTALLQQVAQGSAQAIVVLGDALDYVAVYQAYSAVSHGAYVVGLSTVNPRTVLELVPAAKIGGAMIAQVIGNPTKMGLPLSREFDRVFKKFFDEPPSHQSLSGFVAAQYLVNAARRVNGTINRASLLAALQAITKTEVYGFELNYQTVPQRGSKFVDLMMIRPDGKLVQ